jgi:hypothetical protein
MAQAGDGPAFRASRLRPGIVSRGKPRALCFTGTPNVRRAGMRPHANNIPLQSGGGKEG